MRSDTPAVEADVLVVGAGLAGASAACGLASAGRRVVVLDKGRGPGGRLSTRRIVGGTFDHGAASLQARGADFIAWLEGAVAAGAAATLPGAGWVGCPGMNALVQHALGGVEPRWGEAVASLQRRGDRWVARDAAGVPLAEAASLVLAVPPAQAAVVLDAGLALAGTAPADSARVRELVNALATAGHAPVWAVLVQLSNAGACALGAAAVGGRIDPVTGPLQRIVLDDNKPGRAAVGHAVLHATVAWSERHLEDPAEVVAVALVDALRGAVALDPDAVRSATTHRWRYALPAAGCATAGDDGLSIALAGDAIGWAPEAGVPPAEQAWRSGRAAAERVLRDQPKS